MFTIAFLFLKLIILEYFTVVDSPNKNKKTIHYDKRFKN
jgi:hypothetical protein